MISHTIISWVLALKSSVVRGACVRCPPPPLRGLLLLLPPLPPPPFPVKNYRTGGRRAGEREAGGKRKTI